MVKQKIVMKLSMEDARKRSKVLRAAVGLHGIISVQLENDQLVIIGEAVDSVRLMNVMRKKLCRYVELISVGEEKPKDEEKKPDDKCPKTNCQLYHYGVPRGACPYVIQDTYEPTCSIL